MANVLIATLGDAPIVVPGMLAALRAHGIAIDGVQIIYTNKRAVQEGYTLLEQHLAERVVVEPVPLPFADAYTESDSLTFLRLLDGLLAHHQDAGNDVYLSLAGGRKHISALMALLTQFYSCVRGLYHLHDKEHSNPHRQYTLVRLSSEPALLDVTADRFRLIVLPFERLAQGWALRTWLMRHDQWRERPNQSNAPPPIAISPAAESFYSRLFQDSVSTTQRRLDLWLTQTAFDEYCALFDAGSRRVEEIDTYLTMMTQPDWLAHSRRIHDQAEDREPSHVQEATGTPLMHFVCRKENPRKERPFYYTQPNPIAAYPRGKLVRRVVITRFAYHINKKDYDLPIEEWVRNADVVPAHQPSDLPKRPIILVAPLGESPMVVTQVYTLLKVHGQNVRAIHLVYPAEHAPARSAALLLRDTCNRRGVALTLHPVAIPDLDHTTVDAFVAGLRQAIAHARQHIGATIALLISGGRKGMSALALYVAQAEEISRIYHTTIRDPRLEEQILSRFDRTTRESIWTVSTQKQAEFLFLDQMNLDDFALIEVPIIPLSAG